MKLDPKALPAPLLALLGFLLSPDFYNYLPEKYSHYFYLAAIILGTLLPQLVVKRNGHKEEAR